MALKKLKSDGQDKEGLREAEIRKEFNGIMFAYGLAQPSQVKEDNAKFATNVSFVEMPSASAEPAPDQNKTFLFSIILYKKLLKCPKKFEIKSQT